MWTFTYDPNGNLLTVTDARGNTITHEYDAMDRLSRRIDQVGRAETFTYDGNGNLLSTTDRKNQTTTFTYDALNRRTRAAYADGAVATFTYDAGGRLIQADDTADPHRPAIMEYDILDRLLVETTALGSVGYQYDALGRRTQMTVSGQAPVTYTYDAASRLRTITQAPLNPVDIQYDALGRRTQMTLPNQVSTAYEYDAASRLTALIYRNASGSLGDLTYQYDSAGNRIAVGGSFARTLFPDAVPGATYDAANRQLTFGARSMSFDANGNLVTLTDGPGGTTLTWDARNRLTALGGSMTASFAYDAQGRRVAKQLSGQLTQQRYDGADIVQQVDPLGSTSYLRSLNIDEALSFSNPDGTYFSINDPLGSTLAVFDPTATPVVHYTYDPFGTTLSTDPAFLNPFQFTGRENDGTGLYFYRARYYRPEAGRFIGEDPIGPAGGSFNLYLYARSNPLRFTDPTGLKLWIYVQASAGAGLGPIPIALEGGTYYLVDPLSGESHQWAYGGAGPGLGFGAAAQLQAGLYDGPDDPRQISSWSLEVNGFAAAGKGVSTSLTGTSVWGNGEAGWGVGPAAGAGAGVSGILTYSWYKGKTHLLPESVKEIVSDLARKVRGKK